MVWNISHGDLIESYHAAADTSDIELFRHQPPVPVAPAHLSQNWTTVDLTLNSDPSSSNASLPVESLTPGCKLYSFVVYTLIVGLFCVVGLIGNSVTFFVFLKDKLKTSTSFLFQGISVIDSFLLLTVFPIYCIPPFVDYTDWYKNYYDYGYAIALVYVFPLAFIAQTATVWATVLVALNRYIAVCKPYAAARLCTVRQAKVQLSAVLIGSVLYNITKFAEIRLDSEQVAAVDGNGTSSAAKGALLPQYTDLGQNMFYLIIYGNIFYLIFMLSLPLLMLTILNIRLMRALKELSRKRAEMQSARQQQDNNVTLVLIVVIIVFTICQSPALATQILWNILSDSARDCGGFQYYFSRISNLLVIVNSSVNFVIYYSFNTRFRQVLRQLMPCGGGLEGLDYQAIRTVGLNADHHATTTAGQLQQLQQQQHPVNRTQIDGCTTTI